jgi:hypothetical protein
MNKKPRALLFICFVLSLVIVLEQIVGYQSQKKLLNSISSNTKQASYKDMPHIDLNQQPEESYEDLVNRPLFIAGRKPVAELDAVGSGIANFDWLLSGIYTSKKGLMVLLTRTTALPIEALPDTADGKQNADNYRKLTLGSDIDNWKITEILKDRIILTQGLTEKQLPLRKPKARETKEINNSIPFNSGRTERMNPTIPDAEQTGDLKNDNQTPAQ